MKNSILVSFLLLTFLNVCSAVDKNFTGRMEAQVGKFKGLKEVADWKSQSVAFNSISKDYPSEWLPSYYEGYCLLQAGMASAENDEADKLFDQALTSLEAASAKSPDNSEINVLMSWVYSMKIVIDPASRGYELGMKSAELTSLAMEQNPDNPRPYLLQGLAAMYTPKEYGGSEDRAKELLNMAIQKYETHPAKSAIDPSWGYEKAQDALKSIQN
jgi:hypothetical protein